MEFLIVSGMSGAGKTKACECLEDLGYYCVDNMPVELIPKFAEICVNASYEKVALVMDIRTAKNFDKFFEAIDNEQNRAYNFKILFLDAKDAVLINRFKETRRMHPMSHGKMTLENAIKTEREYLEPVFRRATFTIDTSRLSPTRMREHLIDLLLERSSRSIIVSVQTFGFKHGAPYDADLLFDVRFLPNPYYIDDLRKKTGMEQEVHDYVFENGTAGQFMDKLYDMIDFLIPKYIEEGKTSLVIAIGCTGGKHRSVAVGQAIFKYIESKGYNTVINHRDKDKV